MDKNKGTRGEGVHLHDESAPTLAELGISQAQSHRWQKIAGIPKKDFEAFIGGAQGAGKELTSISVLRFATVLVRSAKTRSAKPEKEPEEIFSVSERFHLLEGKLFSTVVADPPWQELGRRTHDLWNLPIPAMCSRNAHLYLWVTNKTMDQGFEMLRLWGFRYVTCLTWCKPSAEEGGTHYLSSTEHILFAVRGNLELRHREGTWFQWQWGSIHSEKPDRFYDMVMQCSPGPYAVLFSNKERPGWTCAKLDMKTVASLRQWQPTSNPGLPHATEQTRHAS